jgi:hypothetical protein
MKRKLSVLWIFLLLLFVSKPSEAACVSSTGEWIVCESEFLEFLQEAEENCDGEIVGDVLILDDC